MKNNNLAVAAVLVVAGLTAFWNRQSDASPLPTVPAQVWEHLAMPVHGPTFSTAEASRKVIELGTEGWELVDVETFTTDGSTTKCVYFFKRLKAAD